MDKLHDHADASAVAAEDNKLRLSDNLVSFILAMETDVAVPTLEDMMDDLDYLSRHYPKEWIEKERGRQEEMVTVFQKITDDLSVFRKKVKDDLARQGYVEAKVDAESIAEWEELDAWTSGIELGTFKGSVYDPQEDTSL